MPLRKSMPQMRILIAALIFLAASGGSLWKRLSLGQDLGHDFTAFYLAGRMPLKSLYDQTAFRALGQRLLAPQGIDYFPPYVRPSVFALPLHLIAWMPYRSAFAVWMALQYACYLCVLAIAFRTFRPPFPALAAFGFFFPALIGPTVGQDAGFLAAIIAISLALLAAKKDAASGAVLACGLFKFNLILFAPLVFLLHARLRALAAFCICGCLLAIASALLSPPGEYVGLLQHVRDYTGVPANALSSVRGLWSDAGVQWLYYPSAALIAGLSVIAIKRLPAEEAFSMAIFASYLCSYVSAWYDAVILTLPLAAALARPSPQIIIPACFLLIFPGWAVLENVTVVALMLLFAAAVIPTLRRTS